MKKIIYNKLIRDLIPEIIAAAGKQYEIEIMNNEEYKEALRNKLVEEAKEVKLSSPSELVKELADLLEVVDAIMTTYGLTKTQVNEIKSKRLLNRGGFDKRIKLIWSEDKE